MDPGSGSYSQLQMAQSVSAVYTDSDDGSNDEGKSTTGHHKNHASSAGQPSRYSKGQPPPPLAVASLARGLTHLLRGSTLCFLSVCFPTLCRVTTFKVPPGGESSKAQMGIRMCGECGQVCVCVCMCVCVVCVVCMLCLKELFYFNTNAECKPALLCTSPFVRIPMQTNSNKSKKCYRCSKPLIGRPCLSCGRPNHSHSVQCWKCGSSIAGPLKGGKDAPASSDTVGRE